MKKFRMTNKTVEIIRSFESYTLYQIQALMDIPKHGIKAGDFGGYLESEDLLSHEGSAWVKSSAKVFGNSNIQGDTLIEHYAEVNASALKGDIRISKFARLFDCHFTGTDFLITDKAKLTNVGFVGKGILIQDDAELENIYGRSPIKGLTVSGKAMLKHDKNMGIEGDGIFISDNALVSNASGISGRGIAIRDNAVLENGAGIKGDKVIMEDFCHVSGNLTLGDEVELRECVSLSVSIDDLFPKITDIELAGDRVYDITTL